MFESSRKVAKEASELISDLIGTILETDADLVRAIKTLNSSNFETCYGLMANKSKILGYGAPLCSKN
jgi:hypothetical protein